jgi:hypothetical protein
MQTPKQLFEFGTESGAGWLAHSSGIETALKLRGPEMHVEGLEFQMFQFYRTVGVCATPSRSEDDSTKPYQILKSMTNRKSTFLSEAQWIQVPWSLQPKNSFHRFLDLAAEVPSLLEQADALPRVKSKSRRLLLRFAGLIHRLKDWENRCGIHLPLGPEYLAPHWGTLSMVSESAQPPVRTHRYPSKYPQSLGTAFDALQGARLMLFYWATTLTLYTTVYDSPPLIECLRCHLGINYYSDDASDKYLSTADGDLRILSRTKACGLADKISLWVDFCSQNAWQSFGPAIAIFSLKTAIHWYQLAYRMKSSLPSLPCAQLQKCVELLGQLTFCDLKGREPR